MPDRWWAVFRDEQLNNLIDTALANNFDLRTAWERLRANSAIVTREKSFKLPKADVSVNAAESFPQPDFVGGELVRIGFSADYEIDLWGRIQAQIDAEQYRLEATRADYQAAAITLSAQIASTWYQLQTAENRLQLIDQQIATNQQILELLEARFGNGQIRGVDILRQRQLLEASRGRRIDVEAQAETLEHQLAVLSGQPPQLGIGYQADTLPDLPPVPATGLPSELVDRRPDVRSAYLSLLGADRDVARAISAKYPRISVNASTSLRSNNLQNLLRDFAYSFAGNLLAPIYYGKELRAEVERSEALKNQRWYEYGQIVLLAFQEVEDALIQEEKQRERIANLEEQLQIAAQTYEQLRLQYFNGVSNYLEVLTALNQQQQLRFDILNANMQLVDVRISLYRALAGDFDTGRQLEETGS
jgi:outer membrane protein, multidrug efflux system